LFTSNLSSALKSLAEFHPREYVFMVLIPCYFLAPDTYSIHVGAHRPNVEVLDFHDSVLTFRVEESGSEMWQFHGKGYGNILVHFPWQEVAAR